jgi:flagellar biosynthesis chaperone FliJ
MGICPAGKREDFISNLRDTIKKEDSEIKDLRVKIDIFAKKNILLKTMIENKDQEISFLASKLNMVET